MHKQNNSQSEYARLSIRQLAHEMNSVLDGASRSMRLILAGISREDDLNIVDLHQRLGRVQDAMVRMSQILEKAMSGTESGRPAKIRTVREIVAEVTEVVEPLAEIEGVKVIVKLARNAEELAAGPLAIVLMNGLKNAIEAAAESPVGERLVELDVSTFHDDLSVRITDSGRGLESGLKPGQSTKASGHGIGLSLSRELVERAGGSMNVSNGRTGTVFEVLIPMQRFSGQRQSV